MNAFLKLTEFLENNLFEFPQEEALRGYLVQEVEARRAALAEADANEDIAPGLREGVMFLERFNLRSADLALFQDGPGGVDAPLHVRSEFEDSGTVYLRNTFAPRHFYHAPTLGAGRTWVFVLENKVLAGRERRAADDAHARPLVVCFFQQIASAPDELVVGRIDHGFAGMKTMELTPAELALHLGYVLPADTGRSAAQIESLVEASWFNIPRLRYAHEHILGAPDVHTYKLTEPDDAEDAFWSDQPLDEHTKYAISRRLERQHGWGRARLWGCRWTHLRAAHAQGVPPWDPTFVVPPPPPAPGAPGGGLGRGGGRGRGKGRGGVAPAAPARGRGRGRVAPGALAAPGARGRGPAGGGGRGRGRGRG